jgi:hypothetical protein
MVVGTLAGWAGSASEYYLNLRDLVIIRPEMKINS